MGKRFQRGVRLAGDIFTLLFSLSYIGIISIQLALDLGNASLNRMMLYLTTAFFVFILIKIFVFWRSPKSGKVSKAGKKAYKYLKHILRLVNAAMVIASLVNVNIWSGEAFLPILSAVITFSGFVTMIVFDLITYLIVRSVKKRYKGLLDKGKKLIGLDKKDDNMENHIEELPVF